MRQGDDCFDTPSLEFGPATVASGCHTLRKYPEQSPWPDHKAARIAKFQSPRPRSPMIVKNRRAGDSWPDRFPGYVDADDQLLTRALLPSRVAARAQVDSVCRSCLARTRATKRP
jgi:hypothetical protein